MKLTKTSKKLAKLPIAKLSIDKLVYRKVEKTTKLPFAVVAEIKFGANNVTTWTLPFIEAGKTLRQMIERKFKNVSETKLTYRGETYSMSHI